MTARLIPTDRVRLLVVDGLWALAAGVLLVAGQAVDVVRVSPSESLVTAIGVIGPLALRRLAPTAAALLVGIGIIATSGVLLPVDVAAFAVASFAVADAATSRWRSFLSVAVIAGAISLWFAADGSAYAIATACLVALAGWLAGDTWRERRRRADVRAAAERRDHDEQIRLAVVAERRRLARELHDVIAHDVGVMVVQAGGARQVLDRAPDRARAALLTVETIGREALAELRRLLDLLPDVPGQGADFAPQPTLADVDEMVRRMRDAGLPVGLTVGGEPRQVPDGLSAAAYRIVQEALTNSMKHGGGVRTDVAIDYESDSIVVEVLDEGPGGPPQPAGNGRGLIGMRERAEAFGGTFEAGPRDGRGYRVRATLPLNTAARP
jgi:signal transduction histidine kinase